MICLFSVEVLLKFSIRKANRSRIRCKVFPLRPNPRPSHRILGPLRLLLFVWIRKKHWKEIKWESCLFPTELGQRFELRKQTVRKFLVEASRDSHPNLAPPRLGTVPGLNSCETLNADKRKQLSIFDRVELTFRIHKASSPRSYGGPKNSPSPRPVLVFRLNVRGNYCFFWFRIH